MDLLVIGTGYVGLVAGAGFAEMGHHVTCLDIDRKKIEGLKKGKLPIYEPGLKEIIERHLKDGRLGFSCDYASSVNQAQVCFITVDTPISSDGKPNLDAIQAVARSLGQKINSFKVVVNKSTVPVGTAALVSTLISEELDKRGKEIPFAVASNPEFLKEGDAVNDFMKPDRVIIGTDCQDVAQIMREIYAPFMLNRERLLVMDIASAEIAKYAANAMLATRISFMNEMANLCELCDADITNIRRAIGSDARIGTRFLYAGLGYGGSCLPKDVTALEGFAKELGYEAPLISAVQTVNNRQRLSMLEKIFTCFGGKEQLVGKTIAILGLSFKPDTDDVRHSVALTFIHHLLEARASLRLYDPVAEKKAKQMLPSSDMISWCSNEIEAAKGADALVLATEWKQFRLLNMETVKNAMRGNLFFDGRNQYNPKEMAQKGFHYVSIGRKKEVPATEYVEL